MTTVKNDNIEGALESIQRINQTCSEVDDDITAALMILKDMKAKYAATFRAHGLEEVDTILRRARTKLR